MALNRDICEPLLTCSSYFYHCCCVINNINTIIQESAETYGTENQNTNTSIEVLASKSEKICWKAESVFKCMSELCCGRYFFKSNNELITNDLNLCFMFLNVTNVLNIYFDMIKHSLTFMYRISSIIKRSLFPSKTIPKI